MLTRPWMRGCALACLLPLLTACGATRQVVRTETVEVKVPVHVPLPAGLTEPVPEPDLPAGEVANEDIAGLVLELRAALRIANERLRAIANLQPAAPPP